MGTRIAKRTKNNLNHGAYAPEIQSRLVLHCGGVRKGKDGHIQCKDDNTVQADLSAFKSQLSLHTGLMSADWFLAAARDGSGNQVLEPICQDCKQILVEYMVEQKLLREKKLQELENNDTEIGSDEVSRTEDPQDPEVDAEIPPVD